MNGVKFIKKNYQNSPTVFFFRNIKIKNIGKFEDFIRFYCISL